MLAYIRNYFKDKGSNLGLKVVKETPLRDKHGKPYYLQKMPWMRRNPRQFINVCTTISLLTLFSAPIYYALFADPKDYPEDATWWHHEKQQGKRQIDILRERKARAPDDAKLADFFRNYNPKTEHLIWGDRAKPIPTPGVPPPFSPPVPVDGK